MLNAGTGVDMLRSKNGSAPSKNKLKKVDAAEKPFDVENGVVSTPIRTLEEAPPDDTIEREANAAIVAALQDSDHGRPISPHIGKKRKRSATRLLVGGASALLTVSSVLAMRKVSKRRKAKQSPQARALRYTHVVLDRLAKLTRKG